MKDAKGHGSNKRGEVMDRLAAARQNPNHPLGALTRAVSGSGGPFVTNQAAAGALAQGHPKARTVPVHSASALTRTFRSVRSTFRNSDG